MQHGFWQDFSAAHFLEVKRKRNLIGHTDDLEGEDVIPIGTGIVQDLHNAIQGTLFPKRKAGAGRGSFLMSVKALRELEPTRLGEKPTPDNSIAMIRLDDNNRFVIIRVGRSDDDRLFLSSSVTGRMSVNAWAIG